MNSDRVEKLLDGLHIFRASSEATKKILISEVFPCLLIPWVKYVEEFLVSPQEFDVKMIKRFKEVLELNVKLVVERKLIIKLQADNDYYDAEGVTGYGEYEFYEADLLTWIWKNLIRVLC